MSTRPSRAYRLRLAVLTTPIVLSFSHFTDAQTALFVPTTTGDWGLDANWNTAGNPGAPGSSTTAQINSGGTATISNPGESVVGGQVTLGNASADTGSLTIDNGGKLTTSFDFRVGGNANSMTSGSNGSGTVQLNNGTILVGGNFNIGLGATSALGLGTVTIANNNNNLISVAGTVMAVGNNGLGTFVQNGGTVILTASAGTLNIARGTGSGTYTMHGGTLSVSGDMILGGTSTSAGTGTALVSADTTMGPTLITVGGNVSVDSGNSTNSRGTINLNGDAVMRMTNAASIFTVGNKANGSFNIDNTTAGSASFTTPGTLMVGSLLITSGTTYNTRVQEGTSSIVGSSPSVSVGTLDFGPGTPGASTRLYSLFSGNFTAGLVDLTSYMSTSAQIATFQQTGGTINITSMSFGGGRYQSQAANVTNPASLLIKTTGMGIPGTGVGGTFTYAGGGTIQTSGQLALSGALNNTGAALDLGQAGFNGTMTFTGAQTNAVGSGMIVHDGQVNLQANGGSNLTFSVVGATGSPNVVAQAVIGGGTFVNAIENIGTLNIGSLGSVALVSAAPAATPALLLHVGTLSIQGDAVPSGTLDVAADDAIVDNGALATVQAQVKSGYHSGAWNGAGIQSTRAALHAGSAGIGYATLGEIGNPTTFDGQTLSVLAPGATSSTVVLKYTLLGDANLDGIVNALDFNALATNYGSASKDWSQGDFNYSADGTVNSDDFGFIAANFGATVATSPNDASFPDAAALPAGSLGTLVPEPMSLSLIALSSLGLLQRRRRA